MMCWVTLRGRISNEKIRSRVHFNIVLEEIAMVVNKEQLMQLLYADDLILIGRSLDEVKEKFSK